MCSLKFVQKKSLNPYKEIGTSDRSLGDDDIFKIKNINYLIPQNYFL